MKPTVQETIEHDRLEKWRRYRERNNMAPDAPFAGKHPLLEAYEEALDALNYLEEAERCMDGLTVWRAKLLAMKLAVCCLGAIEALRERGAWGEEP